MSASAAAMLLASEAGADGVGRIPTMTAATTSGVVMSASSELGDGNEAWRAGDKAAARWLSAFGVIASLKVDLGVPRTISTFNAKNDGSYQSGCTVAWTLDGSNDDSSYTTIATVTTQTWGAGGETKTFNVTSPGSYRYYRFSTTAKGGSYSGFDEVQLFS